MGGVAAGVAIAGTLVSGGIQAYGERHAAQANRDAAARDAARLRQQAVETEEQGMFEATALAEENRGIKSAQATEAAAQGVALDSEYMASIQEDVDRFTNADMARIRMQAERRARDLREGAAITIARGEAQYEASRYNAIGSLLGGAGGAASIYGAADSQGYFG